MVLRSSEIKSLSEIACKSRYLATLFGRLDPFTNDDESEQVSQLDGLGHDGVARAVGRQMGNEALVDLDDVDWKLTKVTEEDVPTGVDFG
jgi:hypothetical protein